MYVLFAPIASRLDQHDRIELDILISGGSLVEGRRNYGCKYREKEEEFGIFTFCIILSTIVNLV